MIISEIQNLKNPTLTNKQRIIVKCDNCGKEWEIPLLNQKNGFKKYNKDLCRGCKQHFQVLNGKRKQQYINAGLGAKRALSGKTIEEILGKQKAEEVIKKNSEANKGKNNANYGGKYSHGWGEEKWKDKFKEKTINEIWGDEKANQMKKQYSISRTGKGNNMYGKPSPQGSGNGWSGWYKGWFFRSLKELSFMVNVIERFHFKWKSAETREYKIDYVDWKGNNRTYHPDFIVDDQYLIEIKPKSLWNSDNVKRKKDAAIKFCNNKNLKYKLTESIKPITFKEIQCLIENGDLIFTKRYKEKYDKYITNLK